MPNTRWRRCPGVPAGNLRAFGAERDAAHDGERDAGLVAHEPGQVQQEEQQDGGEREGGSGCPTRSAPRAKETDGETRSCRGCARRWPRA